MLTDVQTFLAGVFQREEAVVGPARGEIPHVGARLIERERELALQALRDLVERRAVFEAEPHEAGDLVADVEPL